MISQEEARKRLEDAVKKFNLLKGFLSNREVDKFIGKYRLYSSQLKEGDELEILVSTEEYEGRYGIGFKLPAFSIVLKSTSGKEKVVYAVHQDGSYTCVQHDLLYQD